MLPTVAAARGSAGASSRAFFAYWSALSGFFNGPAFSSAGLVRATHHIIGHAQVEPDFHVIGSFRRTLGQEISGFLIFALLIKNPSEGICHRRIRRHQ